VFTKYARRRRKSREQRRPLEIRQRAGKSVKLPGNAKGESPMSIQDIISEQVKSNRVVLYMKGTPQMPQCGFSATAVEILRRCGVGEFLAIDVLADDAIRQGIKDFSNWPTVPQLYVNGEFVGGCDIMREMYQSGELQPVLQAA
jgi:monothiol glutaredoxin